MNGKRRCWYGPLCSTPAQIARGMKLDTNALSQRAVLAELSRKAKAKKDAAKAEQVRLAKARAKTRAAKPAPAKTRAAKAAPAEDAGTSFGFPPPAPRRHGTTISRVAAPKKTAKEAAPRPTAKKSGS